MNNKKKTLLSIINTFLLLVLILVGFTRFFANISYAASAWKGYAVYRDGVLGNLNDHAALMDENSINTSLPVIHAVGYNGTVKWDSWNNFLGGNNFIGVYKPKGCTITTTLANSFVSKARELRGISYNVLDQIVYNAGNNTWVKPENILNLRCDGVVEYTYEWYGYRVGGADNKWDITRNKVENYWEHSGFFITPRKQHKNLLKQVQTTEPE